MVTRNRSSSQLRKPFGLYVVIAAVLGLASLEAAAANEYSHWFRHQFACLTDTDSHAKSTQHGSSKPTAIRARRH